MPYAEDSFFTLTYLGRVGLVGLSTTLAVVWIGFAWRLRAFPRFWAILLAFGLFWAFVWLSPQVYYTYYLFLFDDLPRQWVARWPKPEHLIRLLSFTERATLSAHSQGLLGWALIIAANSRLRRNAAN